MELDLGKEEKMNEDTREFMKHVGTSFLTGSIVIGLRKQIKSVFENVGRWKNE